MKEVTSKESLHPYEQYFDNGLSTPENYTWAASDDYKPKFKKFLQMKMLKQKFEKKAMGQL